MSESPKNEIQNINHFNIPSSQNKRRKRKNKNKKQNKQLNAKKKVFKRKPNNSATKTVLTMSAWAEQFTFAATWQLKHQLAYWKAKAKSLQYENGVLHDIIRKNHVINIRNSFNNSSNMPDYSGDEKTEEIEQSEQIAEDSTIEEGKMGEWINTDGSHLEAKVLDHHMENSEDISEERHNIEVSEEFIQFLMINAKHKEELRLERERLQALDEKEAIEQRERKLKARRHYGLSMKELYGDKWQRINALEMCIKSRFMSNTDSSMPALWPVIPFNFEADNY